MFLILMFLNWITLISAFLADQDPFNPIGPWFRHKPFCGLPSFINELSPDAEMKIREIWANFKGGPDCDKEHEKTRAVIQSLPEELRHRIFAGRCGPTFLYNASKIIRKEFQNVWFDHRLTVEEKELQLKKLAYSLLTGESLGLFYKWEEELQMRKLEFAKKMANLSPDARDALEKWKLLRRKESEFLASLPKHIRNELKTLYKRREWKVKTTDKYDQTSTLQERITTEVTPKVSTVNSNYDIPLSAAPKNTVVEKSKDAEEKNENFAVFLDGSFSDVFMDEAECIAFY